MFSNLVDSTTIVCESFPYASPATVTLEVKVLFPSNGLWGVVTTNYTYFSTLSSVLKAIVS